MKSIKEQKPIIGGWICPVCKNYGDERKCKKGVFIFFVGANMRSCCWYDPSNGEIK